MCAISPVVVLVYSETGKLQSGNAHWLRDTANKRFTTAILGEAILLIFLYYLN